MNEQIGQERRKYPRCDVNETVELRLQSSSKKHLIVYRGHTENTSLSGVCITLLKYYEDINESKIKEDIKLQVRIPVLDDKKYLEINGQMVWSLQKDKDCYIGVQFIGDAKETETETALSQFIDKTKNSC